jgi:hypothetical protein
VPYIATILVMTASTAFAAPKPVPKSPYLPHVYRYADARLAHGRDTHGPQKTSLFLSALDRKTLAPLKDRPAAPTGIEESRRAGPKDGPLVGADPRHDQNFLRLLYTLSELSFTPKYRDAADAELKWFLENSASAKIAPWDEGLAWNVMADEPIAPGDSANARARVWMLWDRCFELSPEASKRLVVGLVNVKHMDLRRTGFCIRAFTAAYHHGKEPSLLKAIETKADVDRTGHPTEWLSCAIDCGGGSTRVPQLLALQLRDVAAFADRYVPKKQVSLLPATLWRPDESGFTKASVAMMCVSRYENTGNVAYRTLIHAAADEYRETAPPANADLRPMVFGHAISLELAAWRSTADQKYLDSAIRLADFAVKHFWQDSPLPRASLKTEHFESITGADSLALALVELHLSILGITAVRSPPNTIDR